MSKDSTNIIVLVYDPVLGSRYETREVPCEGNDIQLSIKRYKKLRNSYIKNQTVNRKR